MAVEKATGASPLLSSPGSAPILPMTMGVMQDMETAVAGAVIRPMGKARVATLQVAAVAVLTLVALGGGVVLAERSGGFAQSALEMPHKPMSGM